MLLETMQDVAKQQRRDVSSASTAGGRQESSLKTQRHTETHVVFIFQETGNITGRKVLNVGIDKQ